MIENAELVRKADELRKWIAGQINARRRAIVTVSDAMPYALTVGNSTDGLPEFLLFGVSDGQTARDILNGLSIHLRTRRGTLRDGLLVKPTDRLRFPFKLIDAAPERALPFMQHVVGYFGPRWTFATMQVLIPDTGGKYPPDCADPYSRVPILAELPHG